MSVFYTDKQGNKIKLPKWTMSLAKLQDKIESSVTFANEQLYTLLYEFVSKIFDKTMLANELDGESVEDIDLMALMQMYKAVCSLYAGIQQDND